MNKICESCGMPMKKPEDFGGGYIHNVYCKYCTDEKGNLKDFQVKFQETTAFVMTRMNVSEAVAKEIAADTMMQMPAWQNKFES